MNFEISVYGGIRLLEGTLIRCADVRVTPPGKKRVRTWIKFIGKDDADLFKAMALWAEKGCPSQDTLKEAAR